MCAKSLIPSLWDRNDPEPFKSLHDEIDRVFDTFTGSLPWPAATVGDGGTRRLTPNVDISESDGNVEVSVELPGVDEKDLDVTVTDDVLTIKGEKKVEEEREEKDLHIVERKYGAFQRVLTLPCEVETDKVEAKFDKGVLNITLPKSPEAKSKAHKIEIKPST